jgi:membrane-associated phospholipid phosphatase
MNFIYLIDLIGFYVPLVLFIVACFFLWSKPIYLITYLFGFFINIGINSFSKAIIQEPRPSEDKHILNPAKTHLKRYSFDKYGMPSGHAQGAFYTASFLFFSLKHNLLSLFCFLLSLLTLFQRVKYKNHTVPQVVIGSVVGLAVGYLFYLMAKKDILGKIRAKLDDNAPR